MKSRSLRFVLTGFLGLTILGVFALSNAAPPRPVRRPARVTRPRPRPARVHHVRAATKPPKHRRRIRRYQPVVVGGYYPTGGGVVVVQDDGASSPAVDTGTTGTVVLPSGPVVLTEPEKVSVPSPSDEDKDFAGQPAYEVIRLDDEGMTAVLDVDGQETEVRMIGVAAMNQGQASGKGRGRPSVTQNFMENMLKGESVYVVYDSQVDDTDEDGKYVAYLYRAPDGLLVNLEAIRQGFGVADTSYDFDDKDTFIFYNDKARRLGKGVWGRRKNRGGQGKKGDRPGPRPGMRPGNRIAPENNE